MPETPDRDAVAKDPQGQPQADLPAQQSPLVGGPSAFKLSIRRSGTTVQILLTAPDEYASIEMYERLVESGKKGTLRLETKFITE